MAIPKNSIGGNIVLQTGLEISSVAVAPPSDVNTDAATNGSLAATASGLYQRTGGTWKSLAENTNSAAGRFITGTLTFAGTDSSVSIALPDGAVNGDRVFITADSSAVNTDANVVMYSAECTGGNLVVTARASGGAAQATAGNPSVFFMIDTAT